MWPHTVLKYVKHKIIALYHRVRTNAVCKAYDTNEKLHINKATTYCTVICTCIYFILFILQILQCIGNTTAVTICQRGRRNRCDAILILCSRSFIFILPSISIHTFFWMNITLCYIRKEYSIQ